MSSRPRIRSIKPEAWQDEKVGGLCRDARLLMIGLITMADDEGRLRALPSLILGHVFPWDDLAPRKLAAWMVEVERVGLIVLYESDGKPYAAFRHWRRHQQINKPNPSVLPPPPDPVVVRENSVPSSRTTTGTIRDESGSESVPRVRADRIGSDRKGTEEHLSSAVAAEREDSPEVIQLCDLLASLIVANDPKAKVAPDSRRWRDSMRRLLDNDGRDPTDVERVIRWCQADGFWQTNILSASKLREQYTQLWLRAANQNGVTTSGSRAGPTTEDFLAIARGEQ